MSGRREQFLEWICTTVHSGHSGFGKELHSVN